MPHARQWCARNGFTKPSLWQYLNSGRRTRSPGGILVYIMGNRGGAFDVPGAWTPAHSSVTLSTAVSLAAPARTRAAAIWAGRGAFPSISDATTGLVETISGIDGYEGTAAISP